MALHYEKGAFLRFKMMLVSFEKFLNCGFSKQFCVHGYNSVSEKLDFHVGVNGSQLVPHCLSILYLGDPKMIKKKSPKTQFGNKNFKLPSHLKFIWNFAATIYGETKQCNCSGRIRIHSIRNIAN
jgi:hypothetical protein